MENRNETDSPSVPQQGSRKGLLILLAGVIGILVIAIAVLGIRAVQDIGSRVDNAIEETPESASASGGNWTLKHGVLTLSGSGDMEYAVPDKYGNKTMPWSGYVHIRKVVVEEGVASFDENAFADCRSLTTASLPGTLTTVSAGAFSGCTSLKKIELPDGVTTIGKDAFNLCLSLKKIEIPDSVTAIGERAFYFCDSLRQITIPDGITVIGNEMFRHCSGLESVSMPDSLTVIGDCAFSECSSLKRISLPDGITTIGEHAFYDCHCLYEISIPAGVTTIGKGAFMRCGNNIDVYYAGSESEWNAIDIGLGNSKLIRAEIHYIGN